MSESEDYVDVQAPNIDPHEKLLNELPELPEWSPQFDKITVAKQNNFRMAIVGSSESGKSYLTKHLYKNYFKHMFQEIYVFTNTDISEYDYIDSRLKFFGLPLESKKELSVFDIIDRRRKANILDQENGINPPTGLIIIEDPDPRNVWSTKLKHLWMKGRHLPDYISLLYLAQEITMLSPGWWKQIRIKIFLNFDDEAGKKTVAERFLCTSIDKLHYNYNNRSNVAKLSQVDFWLKMLYKYNRNYTAIVKIEKENKLYRFKAPDKKDIGFKEKNLHKKEDGGSSNTNAESRDRWETDSIKSAGSHGSEAKTEAENQSGNG